MQDQFQLVLLDWSQSVLFMAIPIILSLFMWCSHSQFLNVVQYDFHRLYGTYRGAMVTETS